MLLLCAVGVGCEFVATVDKSGLGVTGQGGSSGVGGTVLGVGGTSGTGGTGTTDDGSAGTDTGGGGSNDTGGAGNSGGNGGTGGSSGAGGVLTDARLTDVASEQPPVGNDASACIRAIPAGWTLSAFNPAATSCPAGFADHPIYSGMATIGNTACTCGCTVTQAGTCQGTLTVLIAPGQGVDTCSVTLASGATVNGANCIPAVAPRVESAQATFTGTGQGGQCTSSTITNASQLMKPTAQHYCDVPPASSDAVCNGTAPTGYASCIISSGSLACPAPFTGAMYRVEDDITLNCSACTGCSVTGTCGAGTLTMFPDGACGLAPVGSVPANNNSCVVFNGGDEVAVGSINYTATPIAMCTGGTTMAMSAVVGPRTICCR